MTVDELAQELGEMRHELPHLSDVVVTMLFGIRYEEHLRPLSQQGRELIVLKGLPGSSTKNRLHDIRQGCRLARYAEWKPAAS